MEAAQVDSSKKDGSQEAAAVMSVDDIAGSFDTTDRDAVIKALNSNPNLYQRVLDMTPEELDQLDEKLKNKAPQPPKSDDAPADADAQPPAAPAAPEAPADEDLTVSLKASDLGTYFTKGRSAQDAIRELVKGKKSADERINYLKNEQIPTIERQARTLNEELQKLKAENEELKKKVSTPAPAPAPQAPATGAAEEDLLSEEVDFFDPETQKKIMGTVKSIRDANKALKSELEALKTNPPKPAPAPSAPAPQPAVDERVMSEFEQIRMLQKNPETEGVFTTSVDAMDVEKQNVAFMEGLARQHGIANIFQANGMIRPDVITLVDRYYDSSNPDAKAIRDKAEAANVRPPNPEDLSALNLIYAIRDLRLKYMARNPITGAVEPIPYEEAHRLARATMPDLFARKPQASETRAAERESIRKGVEHRQQFAPEPKSASSAEMADVNKMTTTEFYRLMKKPTSELSPREIETLRQILAGPGQMSEDEINAYFSNSSGG